MTMLGILADAAEKGVAGTLMQQREGVSQGAAANTQAGKDL
jgi:hypothetical protein